MPVTMTARGPYESYARYQFKFTVGAVWETIETFNHGLGVVPDDAYATLESGGGDTAAPASAIMTRTLSTSATAVVVQAYGTKDNIQTYKVVAKRTKRR